MLATLQPIFLWTASGLTGVALACLLVALYRMAGAHHLQAQSSGNTSMRRQDMRQRALKKSPLFALLLPWLGIIAALLERLDLEVLRRYVRAPYARAGYPGGMDDDEVVALGFLLGVGLTLFIGFSAVVLLGWSYLPLGLLGIPFGFITLVSSLKTRGQIREIQILQALPYLLDLLVLMLRSGTSLRIALTRVVADYEDHPIGVEIGQVLAEIDVGAPRPEAFRRFADRLQIQDINSFTDVIVQSEELGWPLAETLERLADRLASERILRAQAKAGAAGVLVMIPSTLVLASAVLLLFGPVIVRLLRAGTVIQ